jgi:hypothetical protein
MKFIATVRAAVGSAPTVPPASVELEAAFKNRWRQRGMLFAFLIPICAAPADSHANCLEEQAQCAAQAHEAFKLYGWEKEPGASFVNHYNEKLNKCFVEIASLGPSSGTSKVVIDAYEGTDYGDYFWVPAKDKKWWEVPPIQCLVKLPSGERKVCTSSAEFSALLEENYGIAE